MRHILSADDAAEFTESPIVSPANLERNHISLPLLSGYASKRRERVTSWRLPATFAGTNRHVARTLATMTGRARGDELNTDLNPELSAHFCPGAPVYLTHNTNPLLGLANGARATLYALEWPSEEIRRQALEFLQTHDGDVVLPVGLEPSAVLVRPTLSEAMRAAWPAHLTLVPGDVIVPVDILRERVTLTAGRKKVKVSVATPQFDLAFCSTCHKSQGGTFLRLIISLLDRPGMPSQHDFHALYVLLTRVKHGDHLRVLGQPWDLDFVENLRPPFALIAFFEGFDGTPGGAWDRERAVAAFRRLDAVAAARMCGASAEALAAAAAGGPALETGRPRRGRGRGHRVTRGRGRVARADAGAGAAPMTDGEGEGTTTAARGRGRGRGARAGAGTAPMTDGEGGGRAARGRGRGRGARAGAGAGTGDRMTDGEGDGRAAAAHGRGRGRGQGRGRGRGRGTLVAGGVIPTTPTRLGRRRRSPSSGDNGGNTLPTTGRGAVLQRAAAVDQGRAGINVANAVAAIAPGAPAAAVHATIGLWRPLPIVDPAPLSHEHAAYARSLRRGTLTAHGGGVQHSSFFVPFLRAVQGLDDPLIPFLRNTFIGAANWDAAVTRTAAVFTAAGVTPAFTRWDQGGYLGELGQIALLRLENRLLPHWPAEAPLAGAAPAITPLTGGELIMQLVGMRLAEAGHVLGGPALPPLPPQFRQHVLRTTPPTPSSTPTPSPHAVLDPDAAATQLLLDHAAAAAVQLDHAAAAARVLLDHFAAAAQLLLEYAAAAAEVLLDHAAVAAQMGNDRYAGTRVYELWEKDAARSALADLVAQANHSASASCGVRTSGYLQCGHNHCQQRFTHIEAASEAHGTLGTPSQLVEDAAIPNTAVAAAIPTFPRAFDLWEKDAAREELARLMSGSSSSRGTRIYLTRRANVACEPQRHACGSCISDPGIPSRSRRGRPHRRNPHDASQQAFPSRAPSSAATGVPTSTRTSPPRPSTSPPESGKASATAPPPPRPYAATNGTDEANNSTALSRDNVPTGSTFQADAGAVDWAALVAVAVMLAWLVAAF